MLPESSLALESPNRWYLPVTFPGFFPELRRHTHLAMKLEKWKWKSLARVRLFTTPGTIQFMEFSRPEYWSGWPFPSPGDLPNRGIEPRSPTLQWILYRLSHNGSPSGAWRNGNNHYNSYRAESISLLAHTGEWVPTETPRGSVGVTPIIQMRTEALRAPPSPALSTHLSSARLWGSQLGLLQLYKGRQGGSSLGIKTLFFLFFF